MVAWPLLEDAAQHEGAVACVGDDVRERCVDRSTIERMSLAARM
jgi:hypothetical protein